MPSSVSTATPRTDSTVVPWVAALVFCLAFSGQATADALNGASADAMDSVSKELFQTYLLHAGKINSADVQAAIQLVASRSAGHAEAEELVMSELEKCDNRTVQRNLILVMTKILARGGGMRWQREHEARTGEPGQAGAVYQRELPGDAAVLDDPFRGLLDRIVALGRKADRSKIDYFVMALRQSHHPGGKEFLLDVLNNPETGIDDGKWPDNVGGTWGDAKFHAAVALAELGESAGMEWLIAKSNGRFGNGGEIWSAPHSGPPIKSRRDCCLHALSDLTGQPYTLTQDEWRQWWSENKTGFVPHRRVGLRVE